MAAQQRGQGSSPWDNAIQAPRDVRGGSGMNPQGDCGSAAGSGVSSGSAGQNSSAWDGSLDGAPAARGGSGLRPGDGQRKGSALSDDQIRETVPKVPGGNMQGGGDLGTRRGGAVPSRLTFDQGDGRVLSNSRRAEDMGRRR